jgi:NAD(P)-dependent dehydrogenase (short-subunit alcohol dehydrogenase family)
MTSAKPVVIVTGSSGLIGFSTSRRLTSADATVGFDLEASKSIDR